MIDKIEIQQHGESRHLGSHSCEEATRLLRKRHSVVSLAATREGGCCHLQDEKWDLCWAEGDSDDYPILNNEKADILRECQPSFIPCGRAVMRI